MVQWEKRGGMPKAIDAVKQTVEWRTKNKAMLDDICRPGGKTPDEDKVCVAVLPPSACTVARVVRRACGASQGGNR